ncbi:hypothetical protein FBY40_3439 [Microbacterium sp. SLBN-154]|uniref:hypothetical protein n=1 Tax=Microbacterium sp. SLBN-154 TaxID=2768458 RepID=UPI0011526C3E|nr:hypothetical protein [Microbacterium sp. SLBN-154]TQK20894.1 hypothetical protein FBY40_3439 [Microbacterium sp. SLBN-154]
MSETTRTRRPRAALLIALPAFGLVALMILPFVSAPSSSCGNPFGCGSVRNAGEEALTVVAFEADGAERATYAIAPDSRDLLLGVTNEILVPEASCLTVHGGPFWLDRTAVQTSDDTARVPIDHWGARVDLRGGACTG